MTIDIKDLKVGDKVLIEATIDLISRDMTAVRVKDKASGAGFYFSLDQIHSILPREPQVDNVWQWHAPSGNAFKIVYRTDTHLCIQYADGELDVCTPIEISEVATFVPPEQHKEYGFE